LLQFRGGSSGGRARDDRNRRELKVQGPQRKRKATPSPRSSSDLRPIENGRKARVRGRRSKTNLDKQVAAHKSLDIYYIVKVCPQRKGK